MCRVPRSASYKPKRLRLSFFERRSNQLITSLPAGLARESLRPNFQHLLADLDAKPTTIPTPFVGSSPFALMLRSIRSPLALSQKQVRRLLCFCLFTFRLLFSASVNFPSCRALCDVLVQNHVPVQPCEKRSIDPLHKAQHNVQRSHRHHQNSKLVTGRASFSSQPAATGRRRRWGRRRRRVRPGLARRRACV